jgi:hypothetical protein
MAEKSPSSVFVAPDIHLATWVVNKLIEWGIPAEVKPDEPHASTDPLTGETTIADPTGFEVVVVDPQKADDARQMLQDHAEAMAELKARQDARASRTSTVKAVCEECGAESEWPATAMGRTESCPHCTAYMDIPDPDENWDDLDVGTGEGENDPDS